MGSINSPFDARGPLGTMLTSSVVALTLIAGGLVLYMLAIRLQPPRAEAALVLASVTSRTVKSGRTIKELREEAIGRWDDEGGAPNDRR